MISDQIAIIEMLVVFGAVAVFCIYQIMSVSEPLPAGGSRRKSKRRPAKRRRR